MTASLVLALGVALGGMVSGPFSLAHAEFDGEAVEARFAQATHKMAEEKYEEAIALLQPLTDVSHELADDALFLMAELVETQRADPAAAAELYSRLLMEHPDSRVARSAQRRLEEIRRVAPSPQDARWLGQWTKITQSYSQQAPGPAIAAARALLAQAPNWAGRDRVHRWLGDLFLRAGDKRGALAQFLAASEVTPGSSLAFEARLAAADTASLLGMHDQALAYLRALRPADAGQTIAVSDARDRISQAQRRRFWIYVSWGVVGFGAVFFLVSLYLGAGSWRAAWDGLRQPPLALWFMIPWAIVLAGMALADHEEGARAVLWIVGGGLVTTHISGAAVRFHRRAVAVLAHAVVAGLVVLGVGYLAIVRSGLLDLLVATVRFGPDT